jgi:hypothetical protein
MLARLCGGDMLCLRVAAGQERGPDPCRQCLSLACIDRADGLRVFQKPLPADHQVGDPQLNYQAIPI